jgi:hypothetical protein
MMSLCGLQISFPLFFVPNIHLMTSYPETFDSEKVDQDEVFYYKDILHFFLE